MEISLQPQLFWAWHLIMLGLTAYIAWQLRR